MRSSELYMVKFDLNSDLYACVPRRIWWKPWRWDLYILRHPLQHNREVVCNLSKGETIGLMKLYNVIGGGFYE